MKNSNFRHGQPAYQSAIILPSTQSGGKKSSNKFLKDSFSPLDNLVLSDDPDGSSCRDSLDNAVCFIFARVNCLYENFSASRTDIFRR